MKNRTKHLHPCLLQNYQKIQHVTNSHYVLNHSSFILNFVLYNYFDLYGAYSCIRRHTHPFLECLENMSPYSLCAPLTFCRKTTPLYFQMFLAKTPLWVLSKASKVAILALFPFQKSDVYVLWAVKSCIPEWCFTWMGLLEGLICDNDSWKLSFCTLVSRRWTFLGLSCLKYRIKYAF